MRIKISSFIIISIKNGAKHSSYFRPYYGNDGKSGLRPEFMRLSAISTKWKIFWIVNKKSNVLPSRINLYDILKRKLNENNFKTLGSNYDLWCQKSTPEGPENEKFQFSPKSSGMIPNIKITWKNIQTHDFRLILMRESIEKQRFQKLAY